jgi:pimeloyl-ACP methyl ester carboxylesterase
MFLKINSHQLYVEVHGTGGAPVVVLMHHGLGATGAWRNQIPVLVGAGYQVIVYDRWGYGQSDFREVLDIPAFAQDQADLQNLLDQLRVEHVGLIGHSDGGTIALAYAARDMEQQVTCLVCVAAHIYIEPKMQPGIEAIKGEFEHGRRFRASLERLHRSNTERMFYNWFDGWHRPECLGWDLRPALQSIRCPAFIVQGLEDEHATPQHARDLAAAIPGAELWLEPGAKHMFPQDSPEVFNPRLVKFLRRYSHV